MGFKFVEASARRLILALIQKHFPMYYAWFKWLWFVTICCLVLCIFLHIAPTLNICDEADIPYTPSSLGIPNPSVDFSELSFDDQEDLLAQIEGLKEEITVKFLKLQSDLITSLKRQENINPLLLANTLLTYTHDIADGSHGRSCASLFQHHHQNLVEAKRIEEIFIIINPYLSYFNYELLQVIINTHGTDKDKQNMQQYLSDFSEYCKRVPCVEFHEESDCNKTKRTKIKFKLDYNKTHLKLGDIKHIQRRIASILKLKPSVLFLYRVDDGCIVFTFLIPKSTFDYVIDMIVNCEAVLQDEIKLLYVECDHHDSEMVSTDIECQLIKLCTMYLCVCSCVCICSDTLSTCSTRKCKSVCA